jgi:hypothetical protein
LIHASQLTNTLLSSITHPASSGLAETPLVDARPPSAAGAAPPVRGDSYTSLQRNLFRAVQVHVSVRGGLAVPGQPASWRVELQPQPPAGTMTTLAVGEEGGQRIELQPLPRPLLPSDTLMTSQAVGEEGGQRPDLGWTWTSAGEQGCDHSSESSASPKTCTPPI